MLKCWNLILKNYSFQFILLPFLFRATSLCRKLQLQDLWNCALAWFCQKNHITARTHTRTHTHTPYILNSSLTTFLSTTLALHTRHRHEPRKPQFVECCSNIPTCFIVSRMFFTMGFPESPHDISLLRQGKSN